MINTFPFYHDIDTVPFSMIYRCSPFYHYRQSLLQDSLPYHDIERFFLTMIKTQFISIVYLTTTTTAPAATTTTMTKDIGYNYDLFIGHSRDNQNTHTRSIQLTFWTGPICVN